MNLRQIVLAVGLLIFAGISGTAQTTIANTPSTDVAAPGTFYGEADYGAHFAPYSRGGFHSFGVRTIYGLRRNVEVGANLFYTRTGGLAPVELQPNIKWKAYQNEKRKVAVTGGAMFFVPLRAQAGTKTTGFVYSNVSKSFDALRGVRLTGGGYQMINVSAGNGNRKGVMLGYEQPLFKRVSFFADWTSGSNRIGYTGAGLSIPIKKKNTLYVGYNFGNTGRGNNWLAVTFGRMLR